MKLNFSDPVTLIIIIVFNPIATLRDCCIRVYKFHFPYKCCINVTSRSGTKLCLMLLGNL